MEAKRYARINTILVMLLFFVEVIDNYLREIRIYIPLIKYSALGIVLFVCLIESYSLFKKKRLRIFMYPLKCVGMTCVIFAILSIYYAIRNQGFVVETIINLLKIFIPAFLAFVILNTMSRGDIYRILVAYLVLSVAAYIFTIGISNLTLANIASVNFITSYSPFESNFFSPTAHALFLYFIYNNRKTWTIVLSAVFVFMTFKRFMVLSMLATLVVARYVRDNQEISKRVVNILKISFIAGTYGYMLIMQGYLDQILLDLFGYNMDALSMGRGWLLQSLMRNFISYGFGSASVYTRSIEMDLLMIYLEMGVLAIIAYIHYLYEIGERRKYNIYIITITTVELLTAHFFDISFYWIIFYLTVGGVTYSDVKQDLKIQKKRRRVVLGGHIRI